MEDISSTEKLLDLIRRKKIGPAAVKPPLPGKRSGEQLPKTRAAKPRKTIRRDIPPKRGSGKSTHVGVDIGETCLRLVKTEKISDRKWRLIAYQTIPFSPEIRKGTPGFASLLKAECSRFCGPAKKLHLWATIPAPHGNVWHLRIPKIPKHQIGNAVSWSLKKDAPFNERETQLDYEILEETVDQGSPKWAVIAFTAPRADVEEIKKLFSSIGYPLTGLSTAPFAVQTIFRTGWLPHADGTLAELFIGEEVSRISIFADGNLMMSREIKSGIDSLAESLLESRRRKRADGMPSDGEDTPSAPDLEEARTLLLQRTPETPGPAEGARLVLTEEEAFSAILPALERLVRQVDLTLKYYHGHISQARVDKILVTSALAMPSAVRYLGDELGIDSDVLDPFNPERFGFDLDAGTGTPSERSALAPALGMALADPAYTPNLLFTAQDKLLSASIKRFSLGVFAVLLAATLACSGLFLYQLDLLYKKKGEVRRLQDQLSRYQPVVHKNDLLQMAAAAQRATPSRRAYSERYAGLAVIGELAALTPSSIRLVHLKADFGSIAAGRAKEPAKGTTAGPKEAEKKGAAAGPSAQPTPPAQPATPQTSAAFTGNLVVEGVIVGGRGTLESSLAGYLLKLQDSPIFRQVAVQSNRIEQVRKQESLRFTIGMQIP